MHKSNVVYNIRKVHLHSQNLNVELVGSFFSTLKQNFEFQFGFKWHLNNLGEKSLSSPAHQTCVWHHLRKVHLTRKTQWQWAPHFPQWTKQIIMKHTWVEGSGSSAWECGGSAGDGEAGIRPSSSHSHLRVPFKIFAQNVDQQCWPSQIISNFGYQFP